MRKSEAGAQEWTLATVPVGQPADVLTVGSDRSDLLLVHGVRPGVRLVVETEAPFGGPRIVRLGRSRVAVDRRLAGGVRVAVATAG